MPRLGTRSTEACEHAYEYVSRAPASDLHGYVAGLPSFPRFAKPLIEEITAKGRSTRRTTGSLAQAEAFDDEAIQGRIPGSMGDGGRHTAARRFALAALIAVLAQGCATMRDHAPSPDLRPCTDGYAYTADGWKLGIRHFEPRPTRSAASCRSSSATGWA